MTFDIREYITNPYQRTNGNIHIPCPNCQQPDTKNPALSINLDNGAYHCFKCNGEKGGDIRRALGETKDKVVPIALAEQIDPTVTPQEVLKNHQRLLIESQIAKEWLLSRGFTLEMIAHYKLGIKRCRRLNKLWWSISIPIKANDDGTRYYQKLRIQPWLTLSDRPPQLSAWDQKGIPAQVWFTYNPNNATETYLVEGEWDAMMLGWHLQQIQSNCAVATFTCGCSSVPSQSELDKLPGKITIFYDRNDKPNEITGERPGEKGALKVAASLPNRAAIALVPQGEEDKHIAGWDVSDAINAGYTMEDFVAAAATANVPQIQLSDNPLRDRTVTNAQLMARAPDYIDWLVPDMLPSNELFILASGPRTGKSLLAMILAKAVATGDKFLGRTTTQGTVLYVNLEDSEAKIKQRQLSQEWDTNVPIYWLDRFKLSEVEYLKELAKELDARLIILDTLSRIRDDGLQESNAEISRYLEPLQNMAMDLNLSVLLVHHTTKITVENAKDINPFDTIRGSSAIRAVCRGSWILAASDRTYRLCVEHGFGDRQDLELLLDPDTLVWRSVRSWNPKAEASQVELIRSYLQSVESANISDIAKALNLKPNCVNTVLWRLENSNLVRKRAGKKGYPAIYHSIS